MAVIAAPMPGIRSKLNSNQIKGFWAAWGGWCLDGMDAFIYALVLVPALTELLPKSGLTVTPGNIGYYGSVLQALWERASQGATPLDCEAVVATDSYRIRRVLAHWVERGALKIRA